MQQTNTSGNQQCPGPVPSVTLPHPFLCRRSFTSTTFEPSCAAGRSPAASWTHCFFFSFSSPLPLTWPIPPWRKGKLDTSLGYSPPWLSIQPWSRAAFACGTSRLCTVEQSSPPSETLGAAPHDATRLTCNQNAPSTAGQALPVKPPSGIRS